MPKRISKKIMQGFEEDLPYSIKKEYDTKIRFSRKWWKSPYKKTLWEMKLKKKRNLFDRFIIPTTKNNITFLVPIETKRPEVICYLTDDMFSDSQKLNELKETLSKISSYTVSVINKVPLEQ